MDKYVKKYLGILLALILILSVSLPGIAEAPKPANEAASLAAKVAAGELPPLAERMPENPKLVNEITKEYTEGFAIGTYGGNLRTVRMDPKWDGTIWTNCIEYLINSPSREYQEYTPNLLEAYEVSDDLTTFTFTLRKGMKWSDGVPLTTKDVQWKFEKDHANEELTSSWPRFLRTGYDPNGGKAALEIVDDYTFKLVFDGPYGGFIMYCAQAGYEEFLAPAHYLEKFHKDTADPEFLQGKLKEYGYGENDWFSLYELVDPNNWDVSCQEFFDCPNLYPWIGVGFASDGTTALFERNPYYWKVDADGNQLPYIDTVQSIYCVNQESMALKILAGEVDFAYEYIPLEKISMYKENEEKGGYKLLMNTILHRTGGDIYLNWTYEDPAWQEVVHDLRFRKALNLAINPEEILETVYYGFGEVSTLSDPTFDPDAAMALLEEMGMKKDGNGFYQTPSGLPLIVDLYYSEWMTPFPATAQLTSEMWRAIGINVNLKFVENTLMDSLVASNGAMTSVHFSHGPVFPMFQDWGFNRWGYNYHALTYENRPGGWDIPAEVKDFYDTCYGIAAVDTETGIEYRQKLRDLMFENVYYIMPIENITQCSMVSAKLRNFPDAGFLLNNSGSMEQCWLEQ